ncbi:MAG: nitroreductase family protein [Candidatus Woesearchaeota archaeon]
MLREIEQRRSIRRYKPIPIAWSKLMEIVDAARHAPTPGNLQNFSLILVVSPSKILEIAKIADQDWIETAKAIIVVCANLKNDYDEMYTHHAAGAVIENMLLEAVHQGLGACWVEAFDKEKLRKLLKIEESEPLAFITLGIPDETPRKKILKPLSVFLSYEEEGKRKIEITEFRENPRLLDRVKRFISEFKNQLKILKKHLFK